jgi:hypothetical protein
MSKMLSRLFPLPPIKVQTTPVHLRKPGNPWPMRKTHLTQSWDIHKNPSLPLSRELPISWLCYSFLAVAFPFSLINPTSYIKKNKTQASLRCHASFQWIYITSKPYNDSH